MLWPRAGTLRFLCLTLVFAFLAVSPARAAGRWGDLAATVFHTYGRDQGLPHPVPTALAQDHQGFLWIGTQGGLARWDGYRFQAWRANPGVAGSLPDDFVQTLHVDPAGHLWIGTAAGHLAWYDGTRDQFVAVPLGLAAGHIHVGAIVDDGNGGLWIGTDDGLRHLDPVTQTVSAIHAAGLPGGIVLAVLRDRTGALWVGTPNGLVRRAAGASAFVAVPLGNTMAGVSALLQEPNGRIWIGTVQNGLFAIDAPGAAPRPIGDPAAIAPNTVSSLTLAGPHEIWAGLRSIGIIAVDTKTGETRAIRHDRTLPNSLAHDDVWALLTDNAGSIWVGGTGGLGHHLPSPGGVISTVFGALEHPDNLSAADVLSILPTRDGRIWLGYIDGGVDVIDPVRGRVAALRPGQSGLPRESVFAMVEADDGTVYIGTRRGLFASDRAARSARPVLLNGPDPHMAINALLLDAGTLWIGGERDGLWQGQPHGAGSIALKQIDPAKLSNTNITVIVRGKGSDLWVGTRNGLNRIDLASGAIDRIMADPADHEALGGRFVSGILIDRKGRLWVGTFGGGLAMATGHWADGRPIFRRFGLTEGLPHINVDSLAMDGAGTIWAGTDDGLAMIDPANLAIRSITPSDGSVLRDYFVGSRGADAAGEALFGAKGGLAIVRPGILPPWGFKAPIVVTDLRVGGIAQPIGPLNAGGDIAPVILTRDTNSIAVEFAALDFTAPEHNRYAYKLDGFDRDWTETDPNRRLAAYTNLPPGDYVLRLRGSNRDGAWTERDLAIPIRVRAAWHQRNWVRVVVAAFLVWALMALMRWRTRHLHRRQSELEKQIAERTADLQAANERLMLLTRTDTLTGLASRQHFVEGAHEFIALANRHAVPCSLIVLDLDEFKHVNDTWGHPAGDAALAMTGKTLSSLVRVTDLVGRLGGEEFAIAMPHTDIEGAKLLAERLRAAIAAGRVDADGDTVRVTASFGVAELSSQEDFESLYARADAALYSAKERGRNRIEIG
jgi:diguanylate cyclase (GGDEF)-like protein